MLKLKLQNFGHLMQRTDSLEKTLMLGKIEGRKRRDGRGWDCWMASLTWWTWVWASSGCWWWTGKPGMLQLMGSQRVGHNWATELRSCLFVGILFPVFLPIFKFRTTYFIEIVINTDSVAGLRVNGQHLPVMSTWPMVSFDIKSIFHWIHPIHFVF